MLSRMFGVLLLVLFGGDLLFAQDGTWKQWRGPTRDGHVPASPTWPDSLGDDVFQKIWRVEDLGPSYSGPIVAEDRVFTTETAGKKDEIVHCLDRATGKELWKTSWPGSMTVAFFAAENGSWIRATPAYDGETLYVAGIRDVLVALDGKTGKEKWRVDFMEEFKTPLPSFGNVSSPLVDAEFVYVQAGNSFVKLDKKTGKVIFRVLIDSTGGAYGSAFSSPVFGKLLGRDQILVQTRTKLVGVDREKGTELWSREIPAFRGMNIFTPIQYGEDNVFTSAYGGKSLLLQLKNDKDKPEVSDAWTQKYEGYMSTPVVVKDHVYMHLRNRRLVCMSMKDGSEAWITEKTYGRYWSFVAQGDRILGLDERGILWLLKANPEKFDVIAERKLPLPETWAHVAVAGNEVYIRDLQGITAYRWSK